MRIIFLMFVLIPPLLGILLLQGARKQIKSFLKITPVLSGETDLEKFKSLARRQMYTSLIQGLILSLPIVAFGVGVLKHVLFPSDFIWIVLPSVVVILIALRFRSDEQKIWNIPTESHELESERDRIISSWRFKVLPDF